MPLQICGWFWEEGGSERQGGERASVPRDVSRELSLYELDMPVHVFVRQDEPGSSDHAGEREGRVGRGGPGVRGWRGPGGRTGLRAVTQASDHRQGALRASWVCARPGQEQGVAVSALLRNLSLRPLVRGVRKVATPPPPAPRSPNHSSPRLRTPTWVLPPLPRPGRSAISKEHAPPPHRREGPSA